MRSEEVGVFVEESFEHTAREKSERFAIRIIRLYQYLKDEQHEYVLSKQILRSGTSIGANLEEARYAVSRNDFYAKLYISLKECAETLYWLRLLKATDYLTNKMFNSLYADCEEIRKMLLASTKTIKDGKNS